MGCIDIAKDSVPNAILVLSKLFVLIDHDWVGRTSFARGVDVVVKCHLRFLVVEVIVKQRCFFHTFALTSALAMSAIPALSGACRALQGR